MKKQIVTFGLLLISNLGFTSETNMILELNSGSGITKAQLNVIRALAAGEIARGRVSRYEEKLVTGGFELNIAKFCLEMRPDAPFDDLQVQMRELKISGVSVKSGDCQ